jgi:hypothetical protein
MNKYNYFKNKLPFYSEQPEQFVNVFLIGVNDGKFSGSFRLGNDCSYLSDKEKTALGVTCFSFYFSIDWMEVVVAFFKIISWQ